MNHLFNLLLDWEFQEFTGLA